MEVKVQLIDGIIIPDLDTVRQMVSALKIRMEENPVLKSDFDRDPRGVLGSVGLSQDIQGEILKDDGNLNEIPEGCAVTCGMTGCACSGCCFTGRG